MSTAFYVVIVAVISGLWRVAAEANDGAVAGYSAVALTWYIVTSEAATVSLDIRMIDDIGARHRIRRGRRRAAAAGVGPRQSAWRRSSAAPSRGSSRAWSPARSSRRSPRADRRDRQRCCSRRRASSSPSRATSSRSTRSRPAPSGSATPARRGSSTRSSCSSSEACSSRSRCFPDWLERIASMLPFQAMAYAPARLASGHVEPALLLDQIGVAGRPDVRRQRRVRGR